MKLSAIASRFSQTQSIKSILRGLKRKMLFSCALGIIVSSTFSYADALELKTARYEGHRYVEGIVDLTKEPLKLYWKNEQTEQDFASIPSLARHLSADWHEELLFAVNSGIYAEHYTPLGLFIEKGITKVPLNTVTFNEGQGNFALLPNGVFYVDDHNRAYIETTDKFAEFSQDKPIQYATQSGPMLLINGDYNHRFIEHSRSLKIRSGVCVMDQKVHFVVTEDSVNFFEFATYFKDEIGCQDALYLDGTLARLYYRGKTYGAPFWKAKPLVGIWGVTRPITRPTP